MRNDDNFFEELNLFLKKYNVSMEIFALVFSSIILILLILKVKKIDKNERFFKILFSDKYDENFGGKIFMKYNSRHRMIFDLFCISIVFLIAFILSIRGLFID